MSYPEDMRPQDPAGDDPMAEGAMRTRARDRTQRIEREQRAGEHPVDRDAPSYDETGQERAYDDDPAYDRIRVEHEPHDGPVLGRTIPPAADAHRDVDRDRDEPDAIRKLRQPDNRARLLVAIAVMAGLTLVLALATLLTTLAHAGDDEPVLVDGVPCLVQDGPDGQSLLFCQR